jgi:hypothetical protein
MRRLLQRFDHDARGASLLADTTPEPADLAERVRDQLRELAPDVTL